MGNFFLWCILLGVLMGFSYDWLRVFRRVKSCTGFRIAMEDFCYWVIWAGIIIYFLLEFNHGSLRWYIFGGIMIGAIFYECTISCAFLNKLSYILLWIKKHLKKVNKLLKNVIKKFKILDSYKK